MICRICGEKGHAKGLCIKHYDAQPDRVEKAKKRSFEYIQNPDIKKKRIEYNRNNKDKIKKYNSSEERIKRRKELYNRPESREKEKQYKSLPKYKNRRNKINKIRYDNDIEYKIRTLLRARLLSALKKNIKKGSILNSLGCSIDEFKIYIENQFTDGMTWENYGNEWHIDHIRQCALYDLSNQNEVNQCFNYKNMRPLWKKDNLARPKYANKREVKRIKNIIRISKNEVNVEYFNGVNNCKTIRKLNKDHRGIYIIFENKKIYIQ